MKTRWIALGGRHVSQPAYRPCGKWYAGSGRC